MFTDIHFGCHQNSTQHNEDCLTFVDWFLAKCKQNAVDCIFFLGDWFEHRNTINVLTNKYSAAALRKLNDCGIPIIFILGNHDLYHRHNRDVHSAEMFTNFEHIHVIDFPTIINERLLVLPFLFEDEYAQVVNIVNEVDYVFGHLEFRNFYLTGTTQVAEHGFYHKLFDGPKQIFSGHYHKRQASDNVLYIGNTFGTSYADAGDYDRGGCLLDLTTDDIDFFDYVDGPTYLKTKLSLMLAGEVVPKEKARVRCLLDVDVTYSEAQTLKAEFLELYKLREFSLEENAKEQQAAVAETALEELEELDLSQLDETVMKLIETGVQSTTSIYPSYLVELYKEL